MRNGDDVQRFGGVISLIEAGHVVFLNEGVSLLDSHGSWLSLFDDHATQRREGPFVDPIVVLPKPRTLQRQQPADAARLMLAGASGQKQPGIIETGWSTWGISYFLRGATAITFVTRLR